jgi:hypothetical protein
MEKPTQSCGTGIRCQFMSNERGLELLAGKMAWNVEQDKSPYQFFESLKNLTRSNKC